MTELRAIFDEDATRYERARPGYPPQLFDDLAALAGIGPGCRVLEIGPGTGKATVPLAERGCQVLAVELGANLAAVAQRQLAGLANATVVIGEFETWPLPAEPFDVVFAATAYHWLDPAVRVGRCARALRPGGVLAVVETHHIAGRDGFFDEAQRCYERWDPDTTPGMRLPTAEQIPRTCDASGSDWFSQAQIRRYEWDQTYSRESYLDLLLTYSGHRAQPPALRDGLLGCLGELIEQEYGGQVTKRYLTQLWTCMRR